MIKNKEIERSIITTYRKRIWAKFIKAISEFKMINEGDKIAVCISGGKDSFLLAKCIQELKRHSDVNFEVEYIVMNPGYNKENYEKIIENAGILDIPIDIFPSNIFDVVSKEEKNPCYLCARMRRGCLYEYASSKGCNKIALGHHFNDVIETVLLSILYGSQMQGMPPKLKSVNHKGMILIRPLYYVKEDDINAWCNYNDLHFIRCACRFTENNASCSEGVGKSKRQEIKNLIRELKKKYPNIDDNILKSTYNVNIDTFVEYKKDSKRYNFLEKFEGDEK